MMLDTKYFTRLLINMLLYVAQSTTIVTTVTTIVQGLA